MKILRFFKEVCFFLFFAILLLLGWVFTSTPWVVSSIFDGMINCFLHDIGLLNRPMCDVFD